MRIVNRVPPNFDAIVAAIPRASNPNVIFTYGDTIYRPSGKEMSPWVLAHEEVHSRRQGRDPDAWWRSYLSDMKFRFNEELLAHRVEWITWCDSGNRNRHDKRAMMRIIAGRLSGSLYGDLVDFDRAKQLILAEPPR